MNTSDGWVYAVSIGMDAISKKKKPKNSAIHFTCPQSKTYHKLRMDVTKN